MIVAWAPTSVPGSKGMSIMRPIRSITIPLVAGLALLMAGVMALPTQADATSAADPLPVPLGTHTFGHLRTPEAIVAKAGPNQVGWESPPPGADGLSFGPWSFDVARDGSIWLLDQVNSRLLVWQPGRPDRPARTVPLPFSPAVDLALGRDGTIYINSTPAAQPCYLYALTPTGQARWKTLLPEQHAMGRLQVVDGIVYHHFESWTPMTDTGGQPLPAAEQSRLASPHQPLLGGLRLSQTLATPPYEERLSVIDKAGHTVRAWRITSKTELGSVADKATLIHDDLVVVLDVDQQTKTKFLWENLVLRLPPTGGTSVRFAIQPPDRATWGDTPFTGLRVGPDGQLYQLRTDRTTGVSIARYSLTPTKTTPPTTTTPGEAMPPSTVAPPPATSTPAPTVTAPATPPVQPQPTTPPVQAQPAGRSVLPWVMAVAVPALLAAVVGAWLWYRRHPAGPRRHGRPRPAH
jgi:hypothetical protein